MHVQLKWPVTGPFGNSRECHVEMAKGQKARKLKHCLLILIDTEKLICAPPLFLQEKRPRH